ncbi:two-pore potassium channel 1-like protein, partial [Tanacetum coccineum]
VVVGFCLEQCHRLVSKVPLFFAESGLESDLTTSAVLLQFIFYRETIFEFANLRRPTELSQTILSQVLAMTSNGVKQASQNGSKKPHLADQISSIKRRRFRRIKSAPLAHSFPSSIKSTNALPKAHPKSVFDHFYPSYWKAVIIVSVYLAVGTLCFTLLRKQISGIKTSDVLDGLYFTIVTMTSVGYGDLVPASHLTILLACLFVVSGMLVVGLVLSKAADLLVEKQERLLVRAMHLNETIGEAEILKKMKTKKVRNKCIILVLLLLVLVAAGTGLLLSVEDLDFVNAFYCVVATLTGLAQLLFTFALLHTERRQRSLVKWVLKRQTTAADLEAADFDGDGIVV